MADLDFFPEGVSRGLIPRRDHPRYAAYGVVPGLVKFEDSGITRVPEAEWKERIEEANAKGQFPIHHIRPPMVFRDQKTTNYCWGNGPCNALDIAGAMSGFPYAQSSAASVCAVINGFRNQGGWGIDAIKFMAATGPCSVDLWPNAAIDKRYDTPESKADRARHKVFEWIDVPPNDLQALVSCLLPPHSMACAVGYDFWSHEVCAIGLKWPLKGIIWNSWLNWGYKSESGVASFGDMPCTGRQSFVPDDVQAVRIATPVEK
jgi:hypothetical protein